MILKFQISKKYNPLFLLVIFLLSAHFALAQATERVAVGATSSEVGHVDGTALDSSSTPLADLIPTVPLPEKPPVKIELWPTEKTGPEWQGVDQVERRDLFDRAPLADFSLENSAKLEILGRDGLDAAVDPELASKDYALVLGRFNNASVDLSGLNNWQLRLSLAASSSLSALVVEYYLKGAWQSAGEVAISAQVSNENNGGYYLFALPAITSLQLADFKIRLKPRVGFNEDLSVFIDNVWLETSSVKQEVAGIKIENSIATSGPAAAQPTNIKSQDEPGLYFRTDEEPRFVLIRDETLDSGVLKRIYDSIINLFFSGGSQNVDIVESHLIGPTSENLAVDIKMETDEIGGMAIRIMKPANFTIGLYKIQLSVKKDNKGYNLSQSFFWGVENGEDLANVNAPNLADGTIIAEENGSGHVIIKKNSDGAMEVWFKSNDRWQKFGMVSGALNGDRPIALKGGVVLWRNDDGALVGFNVLNGTFFSQTMEGNLPNHIKINGEEYVIRLNNGQFKIDKISDLLQSLTGQP